MSSSECTVTRISKCISKRACDWYHATAMLIKPWRGQGTCSTCTAWMLRAPVSWCSTARRSGLASQMGTPASSRLLQLLAAVSATLSKCHSARDALACSFGVAVTVASELTMQRQRCNCRGDEASHTCASKPHQAPEFTRLSAASSAARTHSAPGGGSTC